MKKILLSLFFSFLAICTVAAYIFHQAPGFFTLHQDVNVLLQNKPLLQNEAVHFQVVSSNNKLGSVELRFNTFQRINKDSILFQMKEHNADTLYYQNTYKTDQFQDGQLFPFGFPVITDSSNKTYDITITSLKGVRDNSVSLSSQQPTVELTFLISPKLLLQNKVLLLHFVVSKFLFLERYYHIAELFCLFFISSYFLLQLFSQPLFMKQNLISYSKKVDISLLTRHPLTNIIIIGFIARIILALGPFSGDTQAFWEQSIFMHEGKYNIYLNHTAYNYSPLPFFLFNAIDLLHRLIPFFSWPFLYRLFLSCIDVTIAMIMYKLSKKYNYSPIKTVALFILNPVSIIITGRHGQFDNLALLFILLSVLLFPKERLYKNTIRNTWILTTISILVKHIIFFLPITTWSYLKQSKKKAIALWASSIAVLILTVLPYAIFGTNPHRVLNQVFMYGGAESHYGIPFFLNYLFNGGDPSFIARRTYRYIFIISLILFSYFATNKNILRSLLISTLFFFTFTSGIAPQYMVIPITFGAFFPSKWFYLFTIATTIYFLGSIDEYNISAFQTFTWNTVWLFMICWFVSELGVRFPQLRELRKYIKYTV